MKKVLVIINEWPWKMAGGSNYRMIKAIDYWTKDWVDHDIDVLLPRLGYVYAQRQLQVKGDIIITDSFLEKETPSLLVRLLVTWSRITRIVRSPPQKKYDVIIASSHYLTDVLPAVYLQSKNPSSKFVAYYLAALVSEKSAAMLLLRKISDAISIPLLRKHTDLIFALNGPIRDSLIAHGVAEHKVLITDCGIDEVLPGLKSEPSVFDACYVGRLERGKGVFDLVAIWKAVTAELPYANLAIVGDGSEKDRLSALIEREDLKERISLCGFVDEAKKFDIIRKSKLFLLPSSVDAWGIVVAEAMSNGVPVIVYDVPAFRAVWGNNVVYAAHGDTARFAEIVLNLLRDPQSREALSQNGLNEMRRYLWSEVAKNEAKAIDRV